MRWKTIKRTLPIIGIGLFTYLLIKLNIFNVLKEISDINLFFLPIIFVFAAVFFIFQTLKWFIIAKKQKINIPFKDALKINLMSDFYGFVTPAKLGGVIRADYLKKYGETGKGLSNFAIDKVLDLISLFVLAIGFGLFFYGEIISAKYFYVIISFFVILIFLSFIFYKEKSSKSVLRFFYRKIIPQSIKEKAKITFESFYREMPPLKFLFLVSILSFITWIINYFILYFIGLSLGIELKLIYFLAILPISTLVAQIPITINGLGTRELTMISLFGLFGVEAVKAFSLSILGIIIMNIIPSIIAIFFIIKKQK